MLFPTLNFLAGISIVITTINNNNNNNFHRGCKGSPMWGSFAMNPPWCTRCYHVTHLSCVKVLRGTVGDLSTAAHTTAAQGFASLWKWVKPSSAMKASSSDSVEQVLGPFPSLTCPVLCQGWETGNRQMTERSVSHTVILGSFLMETMVYTNKTTNQMTPVLAWNLGQNFPFCF